MAEFSLEQYLRDLDRLGSIGGSFMRDKARSFKNNLESGCSVHGMLESYYDLRTDVEQDMDLGRFPDQENHFANQVLNQAPRAVVERLGQCFVDQLSREK